MKLYNSLHQIFEVTRYDVWICQKALVVACDGNKSDHNRPNGVCVQIPISRTTDATCDRFLFSIYMCKTLHVSSVKRKSYTHIDKKNLSQVASVGLLIGIYEDARTRKH
jgi:hypothetical protein